MDLLAAGESSFTAAPVAAGAALRATDDHRIQGRAFATLHARIAAIAPLAALIVDADAATGALGPITNLKGVEIGAIHRQLADSIEHRG